MNHSKGLFWNSAIFKSVHISEASPAPIRQESISSTGIVKGLRGATPLPAFTDCTLISDIFSVRTYAHVTKACLLESKKTWRITLFPLPDVMLNHQRICTCDNAGKCCSHSLKGLTNDDGNSSAQFYFKFHVFWRIT